MLYPHLFLVGFQVNQCFFLILHRQKELAKLAAVVTFNQSADLHGWISWSNLETQRNHVTLRLGCDDVIGF